MRFSRLLAEFGNNYNNISADPDVFSVVSDSRAADASSVYVCVRGARFDGHDFARSAYDGGCRAFIAEKPLELPSDAAVAYVRENRCRAALAQVCSAVYGHPSRRLRLIGITGSKGKSTVAMLAAHILNASGSPTAYIGTNGILANGRLTPTENSTPGPEVLHKAFSDFTASGIKNVVMEISSQAMKQSRVYGLDFAAGAFLNLYPGDHIGPTEHADFEEYRACKAEFCRGYISGAFVYNADSPYSDAMKPQNRPSLPFSASGNAISPQTLIAENVAPFRTETSLGIGFNAARADAPDVKYPVKLNLAGAFNAANALAAMQLCFACGVGYAFSAAALANAYADGRCRVVGEYPGRTFVVDYAHNGASLRAILATLREYRPRRLVCLVGSVGDRSQSRRREIGAALSELADFAVLTSDNPGSEPLSAIIDNIAAGFTRPVPHVKITDREEAVRYAVDNSQRGDIVLFAGKGHEKYQLVGYKKLPFDETEIILGEISRLTVSV